MKSPMVTNAGYISDKDGYTDLQVLRSNAGWYIGTLYNNYREDGTLQFQEPGSRDSDYFATEEEAAAYLKDIETMSEDEASDVLRSRP